MTNAILIELFNKHKAEITRGLWKYQIQLKERWDDVIQDTIFRLLKYNEHTVIEENNAKNLFFITLKNMAIKEVSGNQSTKYDINKNTYHTTEGDLSEIESRIEHFEDDGDEFVRTYRERALELMSEDDYNTMLKHFTNKYDKLDVKSSRSISTIKSELGIKTKYVLYVNGQMINEYKSINAIAEDNGVSHSYLNKRMKQKGTEFDYNGERWVIRRVTNIK